MKVFLCKWPDGKGKVVVCRNREELFWALDFESDPYSAKYKVLKVCETILEEDLYEDYPDEDCDDYEEVVMVENN